MTNTAAPAAALPGFTVRPNGVDVRIECDTCHASKAGSLARTWAGSHTHTPAASRITEARINGTWRPVQVNRKATRTPAGHIAVRVTDGHGAWWGYVPAELTR